MKKITKFISLIIMVCLFYTSVPIISQFTDMNSIYVAEAETGISIVTSTDKVKVVESGLRMRASYSTSSAIVGKAVKGNTYQLKAKTSDGKWGQLSTNGYWIYLSYTTPVSSTTTPPVTGSSIVACTDKVKVIESGLRMRASYSTSSAIMGKTIKGSTYQLKAKTSDGKWGQLSTNGYWIYLSYTTPVSSTTTPPATGSSIVACTDKVKVIESGLRMRASYSTSSAIVGKAVKGNTYQLKAKTSDGKWGQLSTNGYWIYLSYTTPVNNTASSPSTPPTGNSNVVVVSEKVKVTELGLRMRASYSTSSAVKGVAIKGLVYQLKAKTKDGKWGQLSTNGYWIYLSYTVPYNKTASDIVSAGGAATGVCKGQDVVNYAVKFIGTPYKWAGTNLTKGVDCSGLVQSVYAHFGISLPRTSAMQATVGKKVSYSQAKPGDLICYSGHVAIYMGNGKIIHSNPSTGVKISYNAKYATIKSVRRIVE